MELDRLNQVIVQMFRRSVGEELLTGCDITWQPGPGDIMIECSSEEQADRLFKHAVELALPIEDCVRKIHIKQGGKSPLLIPPLYPDLSKAKTHVN
jgi:hypothetical protein